MGRCIRTTNFYAKKIKIIHDPRKKYGNIINMSKIMRCLIHLKRYLKSCFVSENVQESEPFDYVFDYRPVPLAPLVPVEDPNDPDSRFTDSVCTEGTDPRVRNPVWL